MSTAYKNQQGYYICDFCATETEPNGTAINDVAPDGWYYLAIGQGWIDNHADDGKVLHFCSRQHLSWWLAEADLSTMNKLEE